MSNKKSPRHASRIAAVQIMYQLDMVGGDPCESLTDFINYYASEEKLLANISVSFLKQLLSHFQDDIDFDAIITPHLKKTKNVTSFSAVTKSIIYVAIIEMMLGETDMPIIINEYVCVSKYFLDKKDSSFINAILDKIATCMRNIS
jgi:transcription antitermination factor NusB